MSKKRTLLIGGYGVGNYGDESILAGLLNQLPSNTEKTAISHDPDETYMLHAVQAIRPIEVLKGLRQFDSIIISGGLFGSHMGNWGKLIPLFGIISETAGIDVEFRGLGIYPDAPKFLFPMIKTSAALASRISVRDEVSRRTLADIGIDNVTLVKDLAFYMDPAPKERAFDILQKEEIDCAKSIVGISITRMNLHLAKEVTLMVRRAIKENKGKSEILFIPMCLHKKSAFENDYLYSEEVIQELPSAKILHGRYHPSEILSIFGLLESCICMRFHSMVFAYRMGTRMIPIPYAEKCSEFLEDIGVDPLARRRCELNI